MIEQIIYHSLPKNGTFSVDDVLQKLRRQVSDVIVTQGKQHLRYDALLRVNKKRANRKSVYDEDKTFLFTVIREPIDRFVSAYNFILSQDEKVVAANYKIGAANTGDITLQLTAKYIKEHYDINSFITELLNDCVKQGSRLVWLKPQTFFLGPLEKYNKIYKLNELQQMVDDLQEMFGTFLTLPHYNKSTKYYSTDDLNDESIEILNRVYADDLAMWQHVNK